MTLAMVCRKTSNEHLSSSQGTQDRSAQHWLRLLPSGAVMKAIGASRVLGLSY
jgi:hypothetical protein